MRSKKIDFCLNCGILIPETKLKKMKEIKISNKTFFLIRSTFIIRKRYSLFLKDLNIKINRKNIWNALCVNVYNENEGFRKVYFPVFKGKVAKINKEIRKRKEEGKGKKEKTAYYGSQMKIFS